MAVTWKKLGYDADIITAQAAADAAQTDIDGFDDELKSLTAAEVQQLQAIGTSTISATQWGYLGAMSQGVVVGTVPCFLAVPTTTQEDIATDENVTIIFGTEIYDQGSNFASNIFTAPVTGKYLLMTFIRFNNVDTAASYYSLKLIATQRTIYNSIDPSKFSADVNYWTMPLMGILAMNATETAFLQIYQSGGTAQTDIHTESHFSGVLIG